jgi:polyhydroxyalkanoate synthesis repressor PhaR
VRYIRRVSETKQGARLIKRYENRKLYDSQTRRYVTLDDLARLVGEGAELQVIDQKTGEDTTAVVLAQVIHEGIKERTASIPHHLLARLIRLGSAPAAALGELPGPQEAATRAREEAERIVDGLVSRGRLTLEEALALRQDITGSVQRLVQDAQHRIEGGLRRVLDVREKDGAVGPSLQSLRERLLTFETFLAEPRPKKRRPGRSRTSAKA